MSHRHKVAIQHKRSSCVQKTMKNRFSRLAIISLVWIASSAFDLPGFTFGPVEKQSSVNWNNAIIYGQPDSNIFAVVVNYSEVQQPTGIINTFPNGGMQKVLLNQKLIYLCNVAIGEAKLLATLESPGKYDEYNLKISEQWQGDSFFVVAKSRSGTRFDGVNYGQKANEEIYRFSTAGPYQIVEKIPQAADGVRKEKWYPPEGKYVKVKTIENDVFVYTEQQTSHKTKPYGYSSKEENSYYYKAFTFDKEKKDLIYLQRPSFDA